MTKRPKSRKPSKSPKPPLPAKRGGPPSLRRADRGSNSRPPGRTMMNQKLQRHGHR